MTNGSEQCWSIVVSGRTLADLAPGDSIVIGRKPLRALPVDGTPRLDVTDPTKSMSKRHALFSVLPDGRGVLRDLNSTNGTFVVRDNGDLSRMPLGQDFAFTRSPMHLQLGDVAVEFVRTVQPSQPAPSASQAARNLFSYAPIDVQETEPDQVGGDLSVDDILDLRTGEPTSAFQAMPRRSDPSPEPLPMSFPPADWLRQGERGRNADDHQEPRPAAVVARSEEHSGPDLSFVESSIEQTGPIASPDGTGRQAGEDSREGEEDRQTEPFQTGSSLNQSMNPIDQPAVHRDLFADARAYVVPASVSSALPASDLASSGADEASPSIMESPFEHPSIGQREARDAGVLSATERAIFGPAQTARPADADIDDRNAAARGEDDPGADRGGEQSLQAGAFAPADAFAPAGAGTTADGPFRPVFEPGSVFERLSQGQLKPKEPAVVVDGMSSDDARTTTDYSMQFQMARRRQLLPFLALNPHLYAALYEFLESLEDPDVESGLANNDGYADFKKGSSR